MRRILAISALLFTASAFADQTLQLPAFDAIKSEGAVSIEVTAGAAQHVVVKASDDEIARLKFEVVDGELMITGPKNTHNLHINSDNKIVITLPSLRLFSGKGVGEVTISNIDGDRVDLAYEGVGSLEASGKTKWLRLKGKGVGAIDTKKLNAVDADVDFDGVGSVDITVTNHLNAVVHGVGALTYYGNPKSVNKRADGLGAVINGN